MTTATIAVFALLGILQAPLFISAAPLAQGQVPEMPVDQNWPWREGSYWPVNMIDDNYRGNPTDKPTFMDKAKLLKSLVAMVESYYGYDDDDNDFFTSNRKTFGSIHKPFNFKSHFDDDFDDDSDDDDDDIDLSKCTVTGRQGQSVEYSCPASSPCTTITAKADLNGRVYSVSKRTKTPCKN